jgi:altronate dehydratase
VALRMHPDDAVAVAKRPIKAGVELAGGPVALRVRQLIGPGHKVALCDLRQGEAIRRYGQTFGFAAVDIAAGDHVHTHNVELGEFGRDHAFCADARPVDYVGPDLLRTFRGYSRAGGRAGTRNYIAVISSVNCSASVSRYVADRFRTEALRREFPNIDGVIAFKHTSGCANDPGEPTDLLQRVLAGVARHPNVGGYLLIGLGCEVNQVQAIIRNQHLDDHGAPVAMDIQTTGGIRKTVEAGVKAVSDMLARVNDVRREEQPLARLALAMNCGGSDGNSGITANPALGFASDEIVRHHGTTVLAETPEIYGAEHLLTRRAVSREVGEKLVGFIRWWEEHARINGVSINNNPSVDDDL